MKSKKRYKIAIVSIALIFFVTTLLGLNLFTPVSTRAAIAPSDFNLKFKQLAVGEDFAIALSYDNQVYGWSLDEEANPNAYGSSNATSTLGDYYPKNPVKINVSLDSGDSVYKIAATRTTAAFITDKGYLYTWGYDAKDEPTIPEEQNPERIQKDLLLRTPNNNAFTPIKVTKVAGIGSPYTEEGDKEKTDWKVKDISGNDMNYVVKSEANNYFIWGNNNFDQDTLKTGYGNDYRSAALDFLPGSSYNEFYAGQGYVIARSGNNLSYKGKNFFVAGRDVTDEASSETFNDSYIFDINKTQVDQKDKWTADLPHIIKETGNAGAFVYEDNSTKITVTLENAIFTDFKSFKSDNTALASKQATFLNSDGTNSGNNGNISVALPSVSQVRSSSTRPTRCSRLSSPS